MTLAQARFGDEQRVGLLVLIGALVLFLYLLGRKRGR